MSRMFPEDTIVAVATPIGEGGIGIVRLSGPRSLAIADRIFVAKDGRKPSSFRTYSVHYGHVVKKVKGQGASPGLARDWRVRGVVDEALLTVMKAPGSYTKEDVVEINCHGGIQAVKKVLDLAIRCGARTAEPGEFTKKAFLNGRIDLAQAEAVLDVIRAKTESSLKVALDQLEGALSSSVEAIRARIVDVASDMEASIDFPDEGIEPSEKKKTARKIKSIITSLKGLSDSYSGGSVLKEGVLAIICGKPNVGKSSLMNLLLKRDRVIVSPVPGTTRDAIEEMICLNGIPIRLVDTAGIVNTKDAVEAQGVARSAKYLRLADIVLFVVDASSGITRKDIEVERLAAGKKRIVVVNKTDLAGARGRYRIRKYFSKDDIVEISVTKKTNIAALEKAIVSTVWQGRFNQGEPCMVTNARHKELLDKALGFMISVDKAHSKAMPSETMAVDLKDAASALGLITGRSFSDDVLERIFEKFCIGK